MRLEGENPLLAYEEPDVVARQIAAFASMEACGDVICFAATFRPETLRDATPGAVAERHVYSFEHQLGTHAASGGDQAYPFLMMRSEVPFDGAGIVNAAQLYPVLRKLVEENARSGRLPVDGVGRNVQPARTSSTPAKIASA